MKRRSFLKMLGIGAGAIALEQAIPFNRVWSFPKSIVPAGSISLAPGYSVRFVSAYDPFLGRILSRLDVLQGFAALPEEGVVECFRIENPSRQSKIVALPGIEPAAVHMLQNYERSPECEQYGVWWREP